MCITEDKLVESYGKATPRERFRLIYKNSRPVIAAIRQLQKRSSIL